MSSDRHVPGEPLRSDSEALAGPAAPIGGPKARRTRTGAIWTAVVTAIVLLVLLIVFIAQNQDPVTLRYLGFEGSVNLGLALFIAAVSGAAVVAVVGVARLVQLRALAHRTDRVRRRS